VHERVHADHPYVDLSTVYRTLAVLRDMRLVTETDMGTGDLRYEWVRADRHHHLICRNCGAVHALAHTYVEDLGAEVYGDHGFRVDLGHIALFGLCAPCLAAGTLRRGRQEGVRE